MFPVSSSVEGARPGLVLALSLLLPVPGLLGCRTLGGAPAGAGAGPLAMGGTATRDEARLGNGVRLVVEEHHAAPVVAIQVWVSSGAADDPPALAGTAHLFEHIALRGTRRRPSGAAGREIEAVGGTLGAWTGLDQTVFHAVVGAPFLDLGLDVLGDALTNPSFDPKDVDAARQQVLAEMALARRDPDRAAGEDVFAAAFGDHPYGRSLLGREATIGAATPEALLDRFRARFVGESITVVVVGDVDAAAAREKVARAFGGIPARAPGTAAGSPAAVARGGAGELGQRRTVSFSSGPTRAAEGSNGRGRPEVVLGFRAPALSAKEAAGLDLLAAVLARAEPAARLRRELVSNGLLATRVRASTFASRRGGFVSLSITPVLRRVEEAVQAAVDEVLALCREDVAPEELARARATVEADLARGEEGLEGHARRLGFSSAVMGDLDYGARHREALRTLTAADLRALAGTRLRASALTILVFLPEGAPAGRDETEAHLRPRLESMIAGSEGRADGRVARVPQLAPVGPGDLVRWVSPSGVRVLILRDTSAPAVTLRALWTGGTDAEDASSNGASALAAALLDRGTRTRSAAAIEAELRDLGGSVQGVADRGTFGLRADFAPRDLERGLALVADCLRRPSFPEGEVDQQRRALLERIRRGTEGPTAAERGAWRLFHEGLWPQGPRRLDPVGSPEVVAGIGRVRLLDFYRRNYPIDRMVLAVVGDVQPKDVARAVAAAFPAEAARAPARDGDGRPRPVTPPPPLAEPANLFRTQPGADATAVVGYGTFAVADPDRPAVEVLAEILGGGDRLRTALSAEGLSLPRVDALAARRHEPGYLAVVASTSPANLDPVVAALRRALARVAAEGVTADEVARAARRLSGTRSIALRGRGAVAEGLALDEAFGFPLLTYRRYPTLFAPLTADQVTRAARRILEPQREVVAVVRPPEDGARVARSPAPLKPTAPATGGR